MALHFWFYMFKLMAISKRFNFWKLAWNFLNQGSCMHCLMHCSSFKNVACKSTLLAGQTVRPQNRIGSAKHDSQSWNRDTDRLTVMRRSPSSTETVNSYFCENFTESKLSCSSTESCCRS